MTLVETAERKAVIAATASEPASLSLRDTWVVTAKELTQLSNRRDFHAVNFILASVISTATILSMGAIAEHVVSLREIATVGRQVFMILFLLCLASLSSVALYSATAIVASETTGRRLDLLRVTSLSLPTLIAGKGFAVMCRTLLVAAGIVPVMAATQMLGGVEWRDVVRAAVIIVVDVFLCTCAGLWVSAGARSGFDRAARTVLAALFWLAVTYCIALLPALAGSIFQLDLIIVRGMPADLPRSWMEALPWGAPLLLAQSKLTWPGLAGNAAVQVVGGLLFLRRSRKALISAIARSERPKEEPSVRALVASRPGADPGPLGRLAAKVKRVLVRFNLDVTGGLVAVQLMQMKLFLVLLPVGLVVGMIPGYLSVRSTGSAMRIADAASMATVAAAFAMAVAVASEACSTVAREKKRRTAALLAVTPSGGVSMLWWKGAALFVSQVPGFLGMLLFLRATSFVIGSDALVIGVNLVAVIFLLYALGISFSLSAKTPAAAAGLLGLATIVIPIVTISIIKGVGRRTLDGWMEILGEGQMLYLLGAVVVFGRNVAGRAAGVVLAVAVGAALGLLAVAMGHGAWLVIFHPFGALMDVNRLDAPGALIVLSIMETLMALFLIAGCMVNFKRFLLMGASPDE